MTTTSAMSGSDVGDSPNLLVPSFLPRGEVLGWSLTSAPNPVTKRMEYKYTVCVQTDGAFGSSEHAGTILVKCDGPCGNELPSNHLIEMGKCSHMLCKACFGLVKNPNGSYGCSNFSCWAETRKDSRSVKESYDKIIKKQMSRAQKLKKDGEEIKACNKTDAVTSSSNCSDSEKNSKKSSSTTSSAVTASSSTTNVDAYGIPIFHTK